MGVDVGVLVFVGVGVRVGVGLGVGEGVREGIGVFVLVGVALLVGFGVRVGRGIDVGLGNIPRIVLQPKDINATAKIKVGILFLGNKPQKGCKPVLTPNEIMDFCL